MSNFNAGCDLAKFCTVNLPATRSCIQEYDWLADVCTTGWDAGEDELDAHATELQEHCSGRYTDSDAAAITACEQG